MTETATAKEDVKLTKAEVIKARTKEMETREKELNKDRTGKGTRAMLSLSRGRNPVEVQYEAFDESQPDTLPADLNEFMNLSKVNDEKVIVSMLIDGFNSASYTTASDPIAEFVDPSWDEEVRKNFRTVIRNYASGANVSIEDAVALIKPGIVASQAKK